MKLSREVSHVLVQELTTVLGAERTQEILSVDDARFKFLTNGHGCVSHTQLAAVERQTGRAWVRWIIDAGAREVTSPEGRAFVDEARAMWDKLLGPEETVPSRRAGRRSRASSLREAV